MLHSTSAKSETSINQSQRFATVAIFVTALAWTGFAVWLGTNPKALLTAFGVEVSPPQMLTEVRAFYGGVELAIAGAMLVLWWRGEMFASLVAGGLPLIGSATGRCIGMLVDGYSGTHLGFAAVELVGAAFCAAGCVAVSRRRYAGSDEGNRLRSPRSTE